MAPAPGYNPNARQAVVLDCEMVGVLGANHRESSEVVRVSAVDFLSGEVLLDTYVSPQGQVISWRTKFSGVNASILRAKKREGKVVDGWRAARDLLWRAIDTRTVLIGHSLNNDLGVLGMVHTRIVDSAIMTRLAVGEDCQRHWALKILVKQFLDRDIQTGNHGHDCLEDTFAAREVVLWCLRSPSELQAWAAEERKIMAEKKRAKKACAAEDMAAKPPGI
jgi:DNA polymerase III epsilon subunit-like protein